MRKIRFMSSAAALSLLVFSATSVMAVDPYDNSNDTVTCGTITKGVIKPKPVLTSTGPFVTSVFSVSGTLGGCTSPSHPALVFPEGKSKFKGTINAPTNSCAALNGSTTASGTITVSWNATDGVGGPGLLLKTSTITLPANSTTGGAALVAGDLHGSFDFGTPTPLAVSGAFTGGDGGATSTGTVITQESVTTILNFCGLTPPKGLKQINLGVGSLKLQ
jgi:hypothetical protein